MKNRSTSVLTWAIGVFVFLASGMHSYAANPENITSLLNQGRGIDAKNVAVDRYEKSSEVEKFTHLEALLDVCMLISDNECFGKYFDTNFASLYGELAKLPRESPQQKEQWGVRADSLTGKYFYRLSLFPSEELVKQQLKYVNDSVIGATNFEYAGLRTALEARAAAMVGNRALAKKLLRRARALVLSRNLGYLAEQLTLAYCLETSAYELFDTQDVKRFIKSFVQAGVDSNVPIEQFVNPYVAARLYRVFYESSTLNETARAFVARDLHRLYQGLQLPAKSTLQMQKESFYAYLALDLTWGHGLDLEFNPMVEFEKISTPENLDAIGVKLYLQMVNRNTPATDTRKLDAVLSSLKSMTDKAGENSRNGYASTYSILSALKFRSQGDLKAERQYLERWVHEQLRYMRAGGFTALDQPPMLSGIAARLVRYVIERLVEIEPSSEALRDIAYFAIMSLNSTKDSDASLSYTLLMKSSSALQTQQIQDRVKLNALYSKKIADAYYKSAKHLIDSRSKPTFSGGVGILETLQLLEKIKASDQQLDSFSQQPNYFVNLNYKKLRPSSESETVVLFAEADGYVLILTLRQSTSQVRLVPFSKNNPVKEALAILTSNKLDAFGESEIKQASRELSKLLFAEGSDLRKNLTLLSGPTALGVPYTLWSNPSTGNWLIDDLSIETYLSPAQREIHKNERSETRPIDYVAFANPSLRSKNEEASIDIISSMIRGAKGGVETLAELPETEDEVLAFAEVFSGAKELYFGKEANIENLSTLNLDNVKVLSFNTHGVLAGEVDGAKSSSVVLSPTPRNNGLIPAEWLFSLNGSPQIVILSTCNSGTSAQPLDNSELTSLSSVFFLKGTETVVSSYWQVNSLGTAEMMRSLSQALQESPNSSQAFSKALKKLRLNPEWNHPSIWAAFVMVGSSTNVPKSTVSTEGELNFELNVSARHWFKRADKTVLLAWGEKSIADWSLAELEIDLSSKKENSEPNRVKNYEPQRDVQISSANIFGQIAAEQMDSAWIFSDISADGMFKKLCKVEPVSSDWLIGDFFRTPTHIFALFIRPTEAVLEYGLASLEVQGCKSITKGPFQFKTGVKGVIQLRLFPLSDGEKIIFATEEPLDRSKNKFTGRPSELGVAPVCNFDSGNYYYELNSSLVAERTTQFANMNIDNISLAGTRSGVIGLWREPCSKKVSPRFLTDKFFQTDVPSDKEQLLQKENRDGIEIDLLVSKNFEYVQRMWWSPDAQFMFIAGKPIFPAGYVDNFSKESIGETAYYEWAAGLNSIFAYEFLTQKWTRLASGDRCDFPQPISYGKDASFLCNEIDSSSQNRIISIKFIN